MGLLHIAGLITLTVISVCTGALPAEPTQSAVQTVSGPARPFIESPLVGSLPSVIAFMERIPIFVEYFTTRQVVFVFPAFLKNHTLQITSSDLNVGSIGNDGWVDLSNILPMNLSEGVFLNLTMSQYVRYELNPVSVDDEAISPSPSKGSNKAGMNKGIDRPPRESIGSAEGEPGDSPMDEAGLNERLVSRLRDLKREDVAPLAGNFTLIGDLFGKTTLSFALYRTINGELVLDPEMTAIAKDVNVLNMRIPTGFDMAFGTIMLVLAAVVTGIMGCELEWDPVKKILKRPFGLVIGFCTQFIVMPLTAFVMCIIFRLQADHALGIILAACSPGGGLSNMTSVAIDANLLLSISMTFFSTIVAMGMMPLNLFIYTRRFQSADSFPIPFTKIIIGLITMVAPLTAGCILRHFKKDWALRLVRILKPVSLVIILFALAGGIYTIRFVFTYIVPGMIVCSFSIPFIAFFLGGLAATVCRRGLTEIKTIAIETAVQNVGIGAGIVRLVYPSPDADIITCAILWTLLGQSCLIFLVIGLYMFHMRILKGRLGLGGKEEEEEAGEIDHSEEKRSSKDEAEMVPLYDQDEDGKSTDAVPNGTGHAHLSRMSRTPPPSAGMTAGAYKFWGYRPLAEASSTGEPAKVPAAPGLFVTFPRGATDFVARQLWAPPIIGPTGDIWIPNEELFQNAPETTV